MLKYSPIMSTIYNVQFLPPATKLEQGNIFTSVCQEFCPQGVCHQPPPWADTPLGRHTPGQTPPRSRHPWGADPPPPGQTLPSGSRQPLSPRSRPPQAVHAGRYGQQAGGTHPTGMHTCLCIFLLVDSETQFSVDSA